MVGGIGDSFELMVQSTRGCSMVVMMMIGVMVFSSDVDSFYVMVWLTCETQMVRYPLLSSRETPSMSTNFTCF